MDTEQKTAIDDLELPDAAGGVVEQHGQLVPTQEADPLKVEVDVYGQKMSIASMLEFAEKNCGNCYGRGLVSVIRDKQRVKTICRCAERNIVRKHGSPADRRRYGLATPEEKREREVEQQHASVAVKTQRLREEAEKHRAVIRENTQADRADLDDNMKEMAATAGRRSAMGTMLDRGNAIIVAAEQKILELQIEIRAARELIDSAQQSAEKMKQRMAEHDQELRTLEAERDRILARRKPMIEAEIKRLEKVERRLALHLARYPETAAESPAGQTS